MSRTIGLISEEIVKEKVEAKEPSKFDGFSVEQLKEYATEKGIEVGNSTSLSGITKKINDAEKAE